MQQTEVRIKVKAYYQLLQIEPEKLRLLITVLQNFQIWIIQGLSGFFFFFLLRANARKELHYGKKYSGPKFAHHQNERCSLDSTVSD